MGVAGELIQEVPLAPRNGLHVSTMVATIHVSPPRAIGAPPSAWTVQADGGAPTTQDVPR